MKIRNMTIMLITAVGIFLAGGSVISQEIKVMQLPEASITKPLFHGKDVRTLLKKLITKKENPALKVKLILSEPVPLFSASP
jgi:hypothetical protein